LEKGDVPVLNDDERGENIWKHIFQTETSQKAMLMMIAVSIIIITIGSTILLIWDDIILMCVLLIITLPLASLVIQALNKTYLLGPSIYSNGILLVSKHPFRLDGEFVPFSNINIIRIGLCQTNEDDISFAVRYSRKLRKPFDKKTAKWWIDAHGQYDIYIEKIDNEILRVKKSELFDKARFKQILHDKNVNIKSA